MTGRKNWSELYCWEILRPMESGSPIRVFAVRRNRDGRDQRAILTLFPGRLDRSAAELTGIEEAIERRQSLIHPLLPRILDLYVLGRRAGLVTTPIDHPRLFSSVCEWSLTERTRAALDLARLLDLSHQRGITWGWLNPGKIFCHPDRIALVNHVLPGALLTRIAPSRRSIRYCAPEVFRDQRATVHGDLYTLGMTLYFLFTGCEPFCDIGWEEAEEKQRTVVPTLPGRLRPGLPGFVDTLVMNLIQKNPRDRLPVREAIRILEGRGLRSARSLPPLAASPLVGRSAELAHGSEVLEEFQTHGGSRMLVVTGVAGIGKTRLLDRLELRAQMFGLPVVRPPREPASGDGWFGRLARLSLRRNVVIRPSNGHQLDGTSLEFCRRLLQEDQSRGLLLAERRLDQRSGPLWELETLAGELGKLRVIQLGPLSPEATGLMLEGILPGALFREFAEKVGETVEGHPQHLLELIDTLRRNGALEYGSRGWVPLNRMESNWPPLPPTDGNGTQLRLRHLDMVQTECLQILALLETPVPLGLLTAASEREPAFTLELVLDLERRGFVRIDGGFADPSVTLANPWISAAVREGIPPPVKQVLADRIACRADRRRTANAPSQQAEAGRPGTRLRRRAADPVINTDESRRLELLYRSGQFDECEQHVRDRLASSCPNQELPKLRLLLGKLWMARGDFDGAAELLEGIITANQSSELHRSVQACLVECHSRTGRFTRARSAGAFLLTELRRRRNVSPPEQSYRALAALFESTGRISEAEPWTLRAIRTLYRHGRSGHLAEQLLRLARGRILAGAPASAERMVREAIEIAEGSGWLDQAAEGLLLQGRLMRILGRHWEADRLLQSLIGRRQTDRPPGTLSRSLRGRALVELAHNACDRLEPGLARRRLEEARNLEVIGSVDTNVRIQLLQARILDQVGDHERALGLAERALRAGTLVQVLEAHLACARALGGLGDQAEADRHLNRGFRMIPRKWNYVRALYRLAQVQGSLAAGEVGRAAALLRDSALIRSCSQISSLAQQAAILETVILDRRGDYWPARLRARKALLNWRATERPDLRSELLAALAIAEARTGNFVEAESAFQRSIGILLGLQSLLPSDLRPGFGRTFIGPLRRRIQGVLQPTRSEKAPQMMVSLDRFFESLRRVETGGNTPVPVLKALRRQFPFSGARLHLSRPEDFPGARIASIGSVRADYLDWMEAVPTTSPIRVEAGKGFLSISVTLTREGEPFGRLYLERPGGQLPEFDFDLLKVLKGVLEQILDRSTPPATFVPGAQPGKRDRGQSAFIGEHSSVISLLETAARYARTRSTILLSGESGTGKELLAHTIHAGSGLKGPFIAVNCATFSPDLIESQLFGHARGAFTGASADRPGFFEAASGGTLFLDEISSMPVELQTRLLRVLEEGSVTRVGETRPRPVSARVVAATNQNLADLCGKGKFRLDLYHRLNVLRLDIPPLRRRASDIPLLCNHFLSRFETELGMKAGLTPSALDRLKEHPFPGNVRELRNLLEKLVHSTRNGRIGRTQVESELDGFGGHAVSDLGPQLNRLMDDLESGRIDFWSGVRAPFLARRISRSDVRLLISLGLEKCGGSYRRLLRLFRMPEEDYKRFLGFLSHHGCKVDYRAYRQRRR